MLLGKQIHMNSNNKNKPAKVDFKTKEKQEKVSKIAKKRAVCRSQYRHRDQEFIKLGTGEYGILYSYSRGITEKNIFLFYFRTSLFSLHKHQCYVR